MASNTAANDPAGARKLGNASIGVSIAGIVVTVVVVIIVVAVRVGAVGDLCKYTYHGTCYRHKDHVGPYRYCPGERSSDGYCYYN